LYNESSFEAAAAAASVFKDTKYLPTTHYSKSRNRHLTMISQGSEMDTKSLVAQLALDKFLSLDSQAQVNILRQLKHSIIGHEQQKTLLVQQGIVEPIFSILDYREDVISVEAKAEAITIIGSLAHGQLECLPPPNTCSFSSL